VLFTGNLARDVSVLHQAEQKSGASFVWEKENIRIQGFEGDRSGQINTTPSTGKDEAHPVQQIRRYCACLASIGIFSRLHHPITRHNNFTLRCLPQQGPLPRPLSPRLLPLPPPSIARASRLALIKRWLPLRQSHRRILFRT
jgi:hypothetical protein